MQSYPKAFNYVFVGRAIGKKYIANDFIHFLICYRLATLTYIFPCF